MVRIIHYQRKLTDSKNQPNLAFSLNEKFYGDFD
ncbi:hypothetical protein SVI_0855 [Shewanella violacea DSS12]|uniref:Uncharacterized protein n=1 Tax=Shewanella violacea (strain JCM 10179 / CIP 106290 / LMG 19151 / DSS12) TaxID=637905 RepID=D4ZGM7_SHEVD|nr:hypothetical protein SVI_0855 [Shewanella violacea DSS12]